MNRDRIIDGFRTLLGGSDQRFIPAVQGLRGLAALSVVMTHLYAMPYLANLTPPAFPQWAHLSLVTGGRGVELFFIISGYLIPASLVRHRMVSQFFRDRALRIMPLFVILHLALFIIGPLVGYKFFPSLDAVGYVRVFLSNLFFVPELFGDPVAQQNAWTLTYEWAFYIWFATVFVLITRGWWIAAVPLVLIALVLAGVFPLLTYFGLGMVMASQRVRLQLVGWTGTGLAIISLIALYYLCEYVSPYLGLIPAAIVFAMVLSPGSGFAQLLESRPLQFVGKVSYSLYLVHPFVLFPLVAIARRAFAQGVDPWIILGAFVLVGAAASILVAAISYELVEVRLRRLLQRYLAGPPQAAVVVPVQGQH